MSSESHAVLAFNRGIISRLGLARLDIPRVRLSAETMRNWIPRVLGSMMLRPGFEYIGNTASDNAARLVEFIFSSTDKALLEFTSLLMRVWVDDELVTRVSVSSTVSNGSFTTDLASWTDNDEAGGVSAFVTGGYMGLTGNGTAAAIRDQQVTVLVGDQNKEHALGIVINRGPVLLRVGSFLGDDDYISEAELQTGTHSLAFTPTGDFHIRFLSRLKRIVRVDSCDVESSGVMTIATPWASSDLSNIRYDQSGDVVFVAVSGFTQRRIERRGTTSWSVVQYFTNDGPYRLENVSSTTLASGALNGNTTLTASNDLFKSTHAPSADNAGAIFRLNSNGQRVTASVTAENQFTNTIRVTGVQSGRVFTVIRTGTWVASVRLQRSLVGDIGPFTTVATYTGNASVAFDDTLDNQIAFYRIGVPTGDFTSGTVELELSYTVGTIRGIARVTGFTSSTVVDIEVLKDFGGTDTTDDWAEGTWSIIRGFPSAVSFHEGRLTWQGKSRFYHSISDAFDSFDPEFEGDAGPINREVGSGPVDIFNWSVSTERLVVGGAGAEHSIRSSSLDEPLTPTNWNRKDASNQGSAPVNPLKVDKRIVFVQRGQTRVYELSLQTDPASVDFGIIDLTQLVPEIGEPSIVRSAFQRQPDTRLHFVRSDGIAAILVIDPTENVLAWLEVESDGASGLIEDLAIVPGNSVEDDVYYVVNRTIDGSTVRHIVKWAKESEAKGTSLNKQADSFIVADTTTELITNGTFDSNISGWTDASDSGGSQILHDSTDFSLALEVSATGPTGRTSRARQSITTIVSNSYTFTINILGKSTGGGGITVKIGTTVGGSEIAQGGLSQKGGGLGDSLTIVFSATSTTTHIELSHFEAISASTAYADDVSVLGSSPITVVTGLGHLEGEQVVVWADGADVGTLVSTASTWTYVHTVSGGQITLATAATNICVGLPYKSQWKSGKLALAAALGSPLTKRKRIPSIGFILADIHAQGLFFGRDFTKMDNLPLRREGQSVDVGSVIADIDDGNIPFPGEWSTDSRFVLEARSPRPVTVVAVVADVELQEQR